MTTLTIILSILTIVALGAWVFVTALRIVGEEEAAPEPTPPNSLHKRIREDIARRYSEEYVLAVYQRLDDFANGIPEAWREDLDLRRN